MRLGISVLATLAILVLTSASARSATVAPGTELYGTLNQSLDSGSVQAGAPVVLTNVTSADGSGAIVGAKLYGHVTQVQRAGQGRPANIKMEFERLHLPNGTVYAIQGEVIQMKVNTKSNAGKEAGAAAAGALIGGLIGHTAGAIIGASGGYLYAKNNRQNVTIPQGSVVTVRLLTARRQASH
ncbi:MAG: hypothetical protein ACXWNK_08460 [Vulcanimicrobiaceae bacterium]